MIDPPQIVQTQAILTAVIRLKVERSQIKIVMGPAMGEVLNAVKQQGLPPAGPMFTFHFSRPTDAFDLEVGVPVAVSVATIGRVYASQLPATSVARTIYQGDYDGLAGAWGEFERWLQSTGNNVAGTFWESYLTGPESGSDPARWRTQLNCPLAKT